MGGQYVGVAKKEIPEGTIYTNVLDGSQEFAPKGGQVVPGMKPPRGGKSGKGKSNAKKS